MLTPGYQQHPHVPAVVGEAIIGGLWNVIQREVAHGRAAQLPELAEELTYIALTPFIGASQAAQSPPAPAAPERRRSAPPSRSERAVARSPGPTPWARAPGRRANIRDVHDGIRGRDVVVAIIGGTLLGLARRGRRRHW